MPGAPHIEVEIEYLPTDKGGRKSPGFSGYRPQFYYNGNDWDAEHEYPDVDQVAPGETARATLRLMSPDQHWGKLTIGTPFLIREGNRTIAFGKVTKLLPDFETDARDLLSESASG